MGEAIEEGELDGVFLIVGEFGEGVAHVDGIFAGHGEIIGPVFAVGSVGEIVADGFEDNAGAAGAEAIEDARAGDHHNPRFGAAAAGVVVGGLSPDLSEDVLRDILGGGSIAEHSDGEGKDDRAHLVVGAGEGGVVALGHDCANVGAADWVRSGSQRRISGDLLAAQRMGRFVHDGCWDGGIQCARCARRWGEVSSGSSATGTCHLMKCLSSSVTGARGEGIYEPRPRAGAKRGVPGRSFQINFRIWRDGGDGGFLRENVGGVEGEAGGDFDEAVGGVVGFAGNWDARGFEPLGVACGGDVDAALGGVDAFGILDRGEFILPVGLIDDAAAGEGKGVEDEGFDFDGVGFVGVNGLAGGEVDAGDFFVGAVVGEGEAFLI